MPSYQTAPMANTKSTAPVRQELDVSSDLLKKLEGLFNQLENRLEFVSLSTPEPDPHAGECAIQPPIGHNILHPLRRHNEQLEKLCSRVDKALSNLQI